MTGTECEKIMKTDSLETIARTLNRADVHYLLVGGLAVNAHGYVRPTKDVDLVIHLEESNLKRALVALADAGYQPYQHVDAKGLANPEQRRQWREDKGMVVLKFWSDEHPETPLDVFIEEPFDFLKEYARSRPQDLAEDCQIKVVALGTLLSLKRAANRPRDLIDIEHLNELHGLS